MFDRSQAALEKVKKTFGTHCHLLKLNSVSKIAVPSLSSADPFTLVSPKPEEIALQQQHQFVPVADIWSHNLAKMAQYRQLIATVYNSVRRQSQPSPFENMVSVQSLDSVDEEGQKRYGHAKTASTSSAILAPSPTGAPARGKPEERLKTSQSQQGLSIKPCPEQPSLIDTGTATPAAAVGLGNIAEPHMRCGMYISEQDFDG